MANFDIELNDEVENFAVEFGEVQRITVDDFDKLRNRPSYAGQTMTHETNIPAVPSKVSQLENDSDYQTGEDVQEAIAGKQDTLTAGSNIQISEQNVISATDTTYSAGSGININNQNAISVDTTVVATQQGLADEVTNRENADIYLQGQIDAISASSDVVDIVGTYADLQNYDTSKLKDNDIIKVLQDETQGNATTYYRWSTHTETFTLIGQEGPYYTKAGADAQFVPQTRTVNGKALSANITLNASDVSALGTSDVSQTTGSSTSMVMSQKATTDALGTKLNITDYVVDTALAASDNPVQNRVLNGLLGDMPSDFFSGEATTSPTASTSVQFGDILDLDDVQLLGDTIQETTTGFQLLRKDGLATPTSDSAYWDSVNANLSFTNLGENWVRITSAEATGSKNILLKYAAFEWSVDTTYTVILEIKNAPTVGGITISQPQNATDPFASTSKTASVDFSGEDSVFVFSGVTKSSLTSFALRPFMKGTFSGVSVELRLTIVAGNHTSDYQNYVGDNYEPYTGGIPAPNPDYPETINVVTGVQTVTVSDGGSNTQTLTIDLGATELCKIGTYQDKIYKSGGDWYVHKDFAKIVADGTEEWGMTSLSGYRAFYLSNTGCVAGSASSNPVLSDHFVSAFSAGLNHILLSGSTIGRILIYTDATVFTDKSSWTTWLSQNNTAIYYALDTPTDTKITDATLISELEAVLNASTYDGETDIEITATGTNLPAPLQITAVNANAKGIIERLRA